MHSRTLFCGVLTAICALSTPHFLFAADDDGYPRAMQGPMIGAPTSHSFKVWLRLAGPTPVRIEYADNPDFRDARKTPLHHPRKEEEYCLTIPVEGLEAGTTYFYRLEVSGGEDYYLGGHLPFSTKTAPLASEGARFTIAYGSCARFQENRVQPIWEVVGDYDPDLFFWLGDNVYADTNDPDILSEEFQRQREVSTLQPVLARVPQLAVWDDHDFGLNNHNRTNPQKADNLERWKRYWPNPAYGTAEIPGIFFRYNYAGVDFFFLDGRYYRDPNEDPSSPGKTMLGEAQIEWLKAELKRSESPFKVLVSGSVWTNAKGPHGDAWSAFLDERDALFAWIMKEQITGVVLLSGDTHTGELNAIPLSENGGYDLYDLTASPLAQQPSDGWIFREPELRIRVPYSMSENFGWLDFDLTQEDPTLTFNLVGTEGVPVWRPFVLKASELVPGVSTWREKQTRRAGRWMQLLEKAGGIPE
jgi:alkaline phosphatase D